MPVILYESYNMTHFTNLNYQINNYCFESIKKLKNILNKYRKQNRFIIRDVNRFISKMQTPWHPRL